MRQVFLAEILSSKGYQVTVCGLCGSVDDHRIRRAETLKEALEDAEVVAAPVPFLVRQNFRQISDRGWIRCWNTARQSTAIWNAEMTS